MTGVFDGFTKCVSIYRMRDRDQSVHERTVRVCEGGASLVAACTYTVEEGEIREKLEQMRTVSKMNA